MKIYSPAGSEGKPVHGLAKEPQALAQAGVAALDNGKPGAAVLLESAGRELCAISGARWLGVHTKGSAATPAEEPVLRALAREADLVLTATAD